MAQQCETRRYLNLCTVTCVW